MHSYEYYEVFFFFYYSQGYSFKKNILIQY